MARLQPVPDRGLSVQEYAILTFVIVLVYAVSRCVYLLYFHPLANFPGPRFAAISNVWYGYQWLSGRYPWAMKRASERYGDVVRVAPNELLFVTPKAYSDIYASSINGRPAFIKSDLLDTGDKYEGLASERDIDKHHVARKQLAPAFSPANLRRYEPVVHNHVETFIHRLQHSSAVTDEGLNIIPEFERTACDLGGIMTFGHDLGQVQTGINHPILASLLRIGHWGTVRNVLRRFPLISPLSYLLLPPKTLYSYVVAHTACKGLTKKRMENHHDVKSLDYLSQFIKQGTEAPPLGFLSSQAGHLVLDHFESSSVLSAAIFFLLTNPSSLQKLQSEVRQNFTSSDSITDEAIKRMPWLNACIEEILRIHTNVPYGLPRISPGHTIDGHYVAKGCIVSSCAYATTHSSNYFKNPYTFAPERWLAHNHPDYDSTYASDEKTAFRPFSMGSRNCLGQAMAYMLLRITLARLFWKFDWELLNTNVDWDRDLRLYMVWQKPALRVKLSGK